MDCQKIKNRNAKYGLLPSKDDENLTPWHTVYVDLIGTYTILAKVRQSNNKILKKGIQLLCMTFISLATGWFEIAEVPIVDQYSAIIFQILNEVWLSIYLRPWKAIFDNGSEFKRNFIPFLKYFSVKSTCIAIKNLQENAISEIIHPVVCSMLNTKDLANVTFDAVSPWSKIPASIVYEVRCSYHITLQSTPVKLVFGRDILLYINFQTNYKEMWLKKQILINYDNKRENAKRVEYDCEVGHYTYIIRDGDYRKLEGDKLGTFRITQVHTNGYVTIQQRIINEQIIIQRLTPYFGDPPT